jgi:hypothetical protein
VTYLELLLPQTLFTGNLTLLTLSAMKPGIARQLLLFLCFVTATEECWMWSSQAFRAAMPILARQKLQPYRCSWSLLFGVVADLTEDGKKKFMYMTEEQDLELQRKGDDEARLMKMPTPLKCTKIRVRGGGSSSNAGFGTSASKGRKQVKTDRTDSGQHEWGAQAAAYSKILKADGIVRIDNVLDSELCDTLRDYLIDLRRRATAEIENGSIADSQLRFADVLLNQNRCDLKVPLVRATL